MSSTPSNGPVSGSPGNIPASSAAGMPKTEGPKPAKTTPDLTAQNGPMGSSTDNTADQPKPANSRDASISAPLSSRDAAKAMEALAKGSNFNFVTTTAQNQTQAFNINDLLNNHSISTGTMQTLVNAAKGNVSEADLDEEDPLDQLASVFDNPESMMSVFQMAGGSTQSS